MSSGMTARGKNPVQMVKVFSTVARTGRVEVRRTDADPCGIPLHGKDTASNVL